MVYALVLAFILFDFATGMVWAFMNKQFNSSVMREGMFHKCASAFYIIFGALVDYTNTFLDLGINISISKAICTYIVIMECTSILENLGRINPKFVPKKIREHFLKIAEESEV